MEMKHLKTENGYKFFRGIDHNSGKYAYNIVPKYAKNPTAGYYDKSYIEKIKGVKF
jgi:hypothetical protein